MKSLKTFVSLPQPIWFAVTCICLLHKTKTLNSPWATMGQKNTKKIRLTFSIIQLVFKVSLVFPGSVILLSQCWQVNYPP